MATGDAHCIPDVSSSGMAHDSIDPVWFRSSWSRDDNFLIGNPGFGLRAPGGDPYSFAGQPFGRLTWRSWDVLCSM